MPSTLKSLLREKPTSQPPAFYGSEGSRRIYFQVWDWLDERRYIVHLHINVETVSGWTTHHFVGRYRAVTPEEVAALARSCGFANVHILPSSATGYQPIVVGEAA
jgi:glycine/sarcosine N-methyltransferase